MNIKPLYIETVFAGFIHLTWLTILTLTLLGKSPDIIFCYLSEIESGTAVFLVAVVFSLSFFLGRIAEHFIIAVNYLFQKNKRQTFADSYEGTKGEIWGNKIFSLSSFLGLLFSGVALCKFTDSEDVKRTIIVMGGILCLGTASSFIYWLCFGRRVKSVKSKKSVNHWLERLKKK